MLNNRLSAEQKGSTKMLRFNVNWMILKAKRKHAPEENVCSMWMFIVGCQKSPLTGQKDF
jgi:hypothetical protein